MSAKCKVCGTWVFDEDGQCYGTEFPKGSGEWVCNELACQEAAESQGELLRYLRVAISEAYHNLLADAEGKKRPSASEPLDALRSVLKEIRIYQESKCEQTNDCASF